MRSYTFHQAIEQIELSRPLAKTNFCVEALPRIETLVPFLRGSFRAKSRTPIVLYQHLLLILSIFRGSRACELLLIRDFQTIPLVCFVWLVWVLRNKICFINTHNLQKSFENKAQRFAFRLLCGMGFKLVFLEGLDGLQEIGVSARPEQFLYLPQTFAPAADGRATQTSKQRRRVGIVGSYRPEKGISVLLPCLIAIQEKAGVDVMIGTRNSSLLKEHLKAYEQIEVVDTSSPEAYEAALMRCDVVVFNYLRSDYYYRGSGVITNALECGATVVCPDFPIFRNQVCCPAPVGCLFKNESGIVEATLTALAKRHELYGNIEAYAAFRNPQAIAKYLDDFAKLNRLID